MGLTAFPSCCATVTTDASRPASSRPRGRWHDHSALAGAHHHGRPTGPFGGRHVCRLAFIPGIIPAYLYALSTLLVSRFQTRLGARVARGSACVPAARRRQRVASLAVLVAIAIVVSVGYAGRALPPVHWTNWIVISTSVGVGVAFVAALINRWLKLGLLSKIAERVVKFRAGAAAGADFPVLGTHLSRRGDADRRRRDGRHRRIGHGACPPSRLSTKLLKQAMDSTAKLTFVVFILIGARVFSLTFYGVDGHKWVEELLTQLPGGQIGFPHRGEPSGVRPCVLPRLF